MSQLTKNRLCLQDDLVIAGCKWGFQDKLVYAVLLDLRVSHTITRFRHPRSKKWIVELASSRKNTEEEMEHHVSIKTIEVSGVGYGGNDTRTHHYLICSCGQLDKIVSLGFNDRAATQALALKHLLEAMVDEFDLPYTIDLPRF